MATQEIRIREVHWEPRDDGSDTAFIGNVKLGIISPREGQFDVKFFFPVVKPVVRMQDRPTAQYYLEKTVENWVKFLIE